MRLILALTGGALGSGTRYLVGVWLAGRVPATFPWSTLTVNVAGSFLIGLLATLADEQHVIGAELRIFLIVGILGGFTTFSSFSLETLRLGEQVSLTRALLYVLVSLGLGFSAALLGVATVRGLQR